MESPERPTKLRKLSHDHIGEHNAVSIMTESIGPPDITPDILHKAQQHQSEHTVHATNDIAVTEEQKADSKSELDQPESKSEIPSSAEPLSKNKLKKQRKKEQWEAGRESWKAKRKEKDAEKKARKREQKQKERAEALAQGLQPESGRKTRRQHHVQLPVTFLIDCGFDDKMLEKERISLGAQVTRAYSDNSRALFQSHLMISSWGGLLKERFDTVMRKTHCGWRDVHFIEQDFVAAAEIAKSHMMGEKGGKLDGAFRKYVAADVQKLGIENAAGTENTNVVDEKDQTNPEAETRDEQPLNGQEISQYNNLLLKKKEVDSPEIQTLKEQGEIVYLTSDSPHTLTELKPYSTYIIGGLVDKNRHKGICYKSACERGMKTAKLPIGQYMEMQSRFVLATNHVVEIMVYWLECGDWGEAFMKAIPKRKGGKLKNGTETANGNGAEESTVKGEDDVDNIGNDESDVEINADVDEVEDDDEDSALQFDDNKHRSEAEDE